MVIEAARNLAGMKDAISAEFSDSGTPVIATMDDQKHVVAGEGDMGGTMRLGLYKADLLKGSVVADTYGSLEISERHRHRYEVNNLYRDQISKAGHPTPSTRSWEPCVLPHRWSATKSRWVSVWLSC